MAQGNAEALATINEMRARSVEALGGSASAESTGAETAASEQTEQTEQTTGEPSISVTINVSDEALESSSTDQVVFVYATATDGPPMPLAVSRISVSDLPATIVLDNSMAMIPTMTLAAFDSVTVGARISTTGNAIAQTGDWFSETGDVNPAETSEITLTIDEQNP